VPALHAPFEPIYGPDRREAPMSGNYAALQKKEEKSWFCRQNPGQNLCPIA